MSRLTARLDRVEQKTVARQLHCIYCGTYDAKRGEFPNDGREEIARRVAAGTARAGDEFMRMVHVIVCPRPLGPDGDPDYSQPLYVPQIDWDGEKWVCGAAAIIPGSAGRGAR